MKKQLVLSIFLAANSGFPVHASDPAESSKEHLMTIKMAIAQQTFAVELADNPTAKAFIQQLPLTMTMGELNGNEKFADLSQSLSPHQIRPGTLHEGDLMLYGRQTLVLFYETFQTSYSYTPIGKLIATDNLKSSVGNGDVKVHFTKGN
ncbi:cyclophilin-like fold protein [Serratia sp. (in: enterobacteria)]|uniref:cyclophilin-like fold protein n=1 Tax=Serratia sp. (in: enterobacteria) TaxID=616 RepID=UPI003989BEBB